MAGSKDFHYTWMDPHGEKPAWLCHYEKPDYMTEASWSYWNRIWRVTPGWAERELIIAIYMLAAMFREIGYDAVVDHIVPLRSPEVCGLHCADNLEVVHKLANAKKSNHTWPDKASGEQLELLSCI